MSRDVTSQPRELNEIEAIKTILATLEAAQAPDKVIDPLREWVFDLMVDRGKYERWMKSCTPEISK